jgi:quinoprotein glucose dehydrogenase
MLRTFSGLALAVVALCLPRADATAQRVEWPVYGGDPGGMRYSPLTTINRSNVHRLHPVWVWRPGDWRVSTFLGTSIRPGQFEATPVMVGDTLFLSTALSRVAALDASTGRQIWVYDPRAYPQSTGGVESRVVHRGVAVALFKEERRVFINARTRLIALSASTGRPIPGFGRDGEVDLAAHVAAPAERALYTSTSPPVVYGNLVIVGISLPDQPLHRSIPRTYVQAFDVGTGALVWRFDAIARPGEQGGDTWENGAAARDGHVNVWAPITLDVRRGLLYLPVGGPSNDFFGGDRKGDNLFANSIVCLDARTGKRVWHFQTVHHGLWDYDVPAPPLLFSSRVNGNDIDGVAVLTKMGFVFAFDRVTGAPIWPIEERPVPQSDVPGERTSPTQPFPTRPAPFAKQGFSLADVIDFTPEVRALALKLLEGYRFGPLYTPPSLEGTVVMPGWIGGSAWGGATFDPETATLYVKANNEPTLARLVHPQRIGSRMETPLTADHRQIILRIVTREPWPILSTIRRLPATTSLPINKPPYGTLTAIDMNTGEHRWQIVLGDEPRVRRHRLLRGMKIQPTGVAGVPGGTVTAGGLIFITGGGTVLYALDKDTGATLWQAELGNRAEANPMTYQTADGRQFVVIATGEGRPAKLVAFSLHRY